jgi:hypothetical protein
MVVIALRSPSRLWRRARDKGLPFPLFSCYQFLMDLGGVALGALEEHR